MSTRPEPGTIAPDFELPADDGTTVRLSDLRGQAVILYFYPRDNTPGCTVEACDFRDRHAELTDPARDFGDKAIVLGVSPDTVAAHVKFRDKFQLPFRLLADPQHEVSAAYGAWGEKMMYGKTVTGVIRSTFLIDKDGRIARVWPKVSVKGHAAEVLEAFRALA